MQGRVHYYEGHSMESVVHGVRAARLASAVLLTNSSGGLDPSWSPGDMMLVTDHVQPDGVNPLLGPTTTRSSALSDMTQSYDAGLCDALRRVARKESLMLREGVYLAARARRTRPSRR